MLSIDLGGRVAVVTGASGGIGSAIVATLRACGAQVAAWDFSPLASPGDADLLIGVDVTDEDAVAQAAAQTVGRFGRFDLLVNSAGVVGREELLEHLTLPDWRKTIDVNLTSVFVCCRAAIPYMRAHGHGRIVNIASHAGKEGNPMQSAYSSAKAGVIGLTKSLGRELAGSGILVHSVTPALIATPLVDGMTEATRSAAFAKIPLGRMGLPQEVANLTAWLVSEHCSFSTGAAYDLSGGRASF